MDVGLRRRAAEEAVLIALSCLASSYILFTMVHPIKYGLFVIMIFFMASLLALVRGEISGHQVRLSSKLAMLIRPALICLSLGLLIMYVMDARIWYLRTVLAVIVAYTIPGYALMELAGIPERKLGPLEKLCFSFAYSLAISFILSLILAPLGPWLCGLILSITFSALAIILNVKMLWELRRGVWRHEPLTADLGELVAVLTSCSLLLFMITYCYPAMMELLGLDIIRVSKYVLLWLRTPELMAIVYPGFVLSEATPFVLSDFSPDMFQSSLAYLSIYLVFSFLLMARRVFGEDKRLSAISLLLFTFFAGLGWLYMFVNMPPLGEKTYDELMGLVFEKTYMDIRQGGIVDFVIWYRPRTVALLILLVIMYSILTYEPRGWRYRLNIGLLSASLFFMHIVEYILLASALLLLAFFKVSSAMRLDKVMEGLLSAWLFIGLIYVFSWAYGYTELTVMCPISLMLALTAVYSGALVFLKTTKRRLAIQRAWALKLARFSVLAMAFFYLSSIMAWLDQAEEFSLASVMKVGLIPWFFYPVLLGLVGFLAVVGLMGMLKGEVRVDKRTVALLLSFVIASLIIGRLLTIINMSIYMGYKERRFVKYIHPMACLLAAPSLPMIIRKVSKPRYRMLSSILVIGLILAGSLSTFYSLEKWAFSLDGWLSKEERDALDFLKKLVSSMRVSKVLTVTRTSALIVEKAAPTFLEHDHGRAIWGSPTPELALSLFFEPRLTHSDRYIIYMHKRDVNALGRTYREQFLYSHLLPMAEKALENKKVSIYLLPPFSPPREGAEAVLVVPEDVELAFPAYELLSFGFFDYTTALEFDASVRHAEIVVLPTDDVPEALRTINFTEWLRGGKRVLVMGEGTGLLTSLFLIGKLLLQVEEPGFTLDVAGAGEVPEFATYQGEVEFELVGLLQEFEPRVVSDDNQTAFWRPTAWGNGTIGVPVLSDDAELKASGRNSLRIDVGSGDKAQWAIVHEYDPPANWSSCDFVSFYWYGRGDWRGYVVWIEAPDEANRWWFSFIDGWRGWRRVFLPLKGLDGKYVINGITVRKITRGNPDPGNVTHIDIRLSGGNPSVSGTWHIDRVVVDTGRWANVRARIAWAPWVEVLVFNGTGYRRACWLTGNETVSVPPELVFFSDGVSATALYGEDGDVMWVAGERAPDGSWNLNITVRMPPFGDAASRIGLRIRTAAYMNVSGILYPGRYVPLQANVSITPFSVREGVEVLAWYMGDEGKIPLLMKKEVGEGLIYYLNAWPVMKIVKAEEYGLGALEALSPALELVGLRKAYWTSRPVMPSHIILEEGALDGLMKIRHKHAILKPRAGELLITLNGAVFHDVVLAQLIADGELTFEIHHANMSGLGFYLMLDTDELIAHAEGQDVLLLLSFQNGTHMELEVRDPGEIRASGSIRAFFRSPEVDIEGRISLRNTYVCSFFEARIRGVLEGLITGEMAGDVLRVFWGDVMIEGGAKMRFYVGGRFILMEMRYRGDVKISPPILTWDEWGSLTKSWPWFLISIAIVTILYGLGKLRRFEIKVKMPWRR